MKKIIYTLLVLLSISMTTYAQKETSWWYFGYRAGLNFNEVSNATADNGSVVPNMPKAIIGALDTREGCFTVSTYDGRLLFSSDGMTVYDKNDNVMLNGTGLLGDFSASQSGIVLPKPGSLTEYYVVTVPAMAGSAGLRYSTVDISKNGGLGEVTTKNILIKATDVYENIAAVPNANGRDYWLIHRSGHTFYIWAVTSDGIDTTPHFTVSNSSININGPITGAFSPQGEVIISPDRKKIISVSWGGRQIISADLDVATGQISDIRTSNCNYQPYGGTFSPNGEYFYVGTGFDLRGRLYCNSWDNLRDGQPMNVLANEGFSNVSLGMDKRLYGIQVMVTNSTEIPTRNLGVVMNPDDGGTDIRIFSNYLLRDAAFGLPTFAAGFIKITPNERPFACTAHLRSYSVDIDLSGGNAPSRLEWDFGDGSPVKIQNTTASQSKYVQPHSYNNSGVYTIVITPYKADGTALATITMQANVVNCTLKTNKMTRSELLNAKELQ